MLNELQIRKVKPIPKPYRMADWHGLYLQVTPKGGKLWRYKYRFDGKEKLMALGKYPEVTLADARERHADARKLLARGIDPMEHRKAERITVATADTRSFKSVAKLWLDHWKTDKSGQHVAATRSRLEKNVYPILGARLIAEIKTPEIVRMIKAVESRGVGDMAKRAMQTTGQIFRYGIAHGYCEGNPVANIKPADVLRPCVTVNLARVEAKDLPALLRAIEIYQGKVITRLATKLLALTFVRTGELIGARWPEIDFEGRRWNIPKERMKMKAPHIVPLSTQAIEVLTLLWTLTGNGDLVFPGEQSGTMSNNTILFALKRMGYGGVMTGHGFRGLASTLLHEQGWPHDHIELQLAHGARDAVSAAYNHALYLEPRAKMMQWWGDYLERTQRGR